MPWKTIQTHVNMSTRISVMILYIQTHDNSNFISVLWSFCFKITIARNQSAVTHMCHQLVLHKHILANIIFRTLQIHLQKYNIKLSTLYLRNFQTQLHKIPSNFAGSLATNLIELLVSSMTGNTWKSLQIHWREIIENTRTTGLFIGTTKTLPFNV